MLARGALGAVWGGQLVWHVPQPSKECGDVESEQLCGSGCSGTIQMLGKVLQGVSAEDVSNDVQGLEGVWRGLGNLEQSGGGSASLACP